MFKKVVKDKGVEINGAFPRMTYGAIRRYGSDKPDTRFEMKKIIDVSQLGRDMDFKVFKDTVE